MQREGTPTRDYYVWGVRRRTHGRRGFSGHRVRVRAGCRERGREPRPVCCRRRKEFAETDGDEVELVFDGAGTQWIPELEDPDNDRHEFYRAVRENASARDFCSGVFGVDDAVNDSGVVRLDDHDGHSSLRSLVADGYEVITL